MEALRDDSNNCDDTNIVPETNQDEVDINIEEDNVQYIHKNYPIALNKSEYEKIENKEG